MDIQIIPSSYEENEPEHEKHQESIGMLSSKILAGSKIGNRSISHRPPTNMTNVNPSFSSLFEEQQRKDRILKVLKEQKQTKQAAEILINEFSRFRFFKQIIDQQMLSDKLLQEIVFELKLETYSKHQIIFQQNDVGRQMYFVLSGKVAILINLKPTQSNMVSSSFIPNQQSQISPSPMNSTDSNLSQKKKTSATPSSNHSLIAKSTPQSPVGRKEINLGTPVQGYISSGNKSNAITPSSFVIKHAETPLSQGRQTPSHNLTVINTPQSLIGHHQSNSIQSQRTPVSRSETQVENSFKEYLHKVNGTQFIEGISIEDEFEYFRRFKLNNCKQVNTIFEGNTFGEVALEQRIPRTASAVTMTDCQLATLSYDSFRKLLSKVYQRIQEEQRGFLKEIPPMNAYPNYGIMIVYNNCEEIELAINNLVYREEEPSTFIYFIKEGEIEISKKFQIDKCDTMAMQKKNVIHRRSVVQRLAPGRMFGDFEGIQWLIDQKKRFVGGNGIPMQNSQLNSGSASRAQKSYPLRKTQAICKTKVKLMRIELKGFFNNFIAFSPKSTTDNEQDFFTLQLNQMEKKIRNVQQKITELEQIHMENKVASDLSDMLYSPLQTSSRFASREELKSQIKLKSAVISSIPINAFSSSSDQSFNLTSTVIASVVKQFSSENPILSKQNSLSNSQVAILSQSISSPRSLNSQKTIQQNSQKSLNGIGISSVKLNGSQIQQPSTPAGLQSSESKKRLLLKQPSIFLRLSKSPFPEHEEKEHQLKKAESPSLKTHGQEHRSGSLFSVNSSQQPPQQEILHFKKNDNQQMQPNIINQMQDHSEGSSYLNSFSQIRPNKFENISQSTKQSSLAQRRSLLSSQLSKSNSFIISMNQSATIKSADKLTPQNIEKSLEVEIPEPHQIESASVQQKEIHNSSNSVTNEKRKLEQQVQEKPTRHQSEHLTSRQLDFLTSRTIRSSFHFGSDSKLSSKKDQSRIKQEQTGFDQGNLLLSSRIHKNKNGQYSPMKISSFPVDFTRMRPQSQGGIVQVITPENPETPSLFSNWCQFSKQIIKKTNSQRQIVYKFQLNEEEQRKRFKSRRSFDEDSLRKCLSSSSSKREKPFIVLNKPCSAKEQQMTVNSSEIEKQQSTQSVTNTIQKSELVQIKTPDKTLGETISILNPTTTNSESIRPYTSRSIRSSSKSLQVLFPNARKRMQCDIRNNNEQRLASNSPGEAAAEEEEYSNKHPQPRYFKKFRCPQKWTQLMSTKKTIQEAAKLPPTVQFQISATKPIKQQKTKIHLSVSHLDLQCPTISNQQINSLTHFKDTLYSPKNAETTTAHQLQI